MSIAKRLAAIDIGSNAIRMVIADYTPQGFEELEKFRFPIRLGADVFEKGKISGRNLKAAARTFAKFKKLTEDYKVGHLRAVGTSALREAKNSAAFIELVRRSSKIKIEVIDGVEEARLIYEAVKAEIFLENHHCLLIDIGGGSVELSTSERGRMAATKSFPLGTVRMLELLKKRKLSESQLSLVIGEHLEPVTHFLKSACEGIKLDFAVGTGGNIESLAKLKPKLLKRNSRNTLIYADLSTMAQKLSELSYKERLEKLELRPDRADVIIPAALLTLSVLRQAGVEKLLIPFVGLRDGVLWSMVKKSVS